MKNIATLIFLAILTYSGSLHATIEEDVAALQAKVEALEAALTDRQLFGTENKYAGTYATTMIELAQWGCQTIGLGEKKVDGKNLLAYLNLADVSSVSNRSSVFDVESDGSTLVVPSRTLEFQSLWLSGRWTSDSRVEEEFDLDVDADGYITVDAGPEVSVDGQMSADGSNFNLLVRGHFDDEDCADAFIQLIVGVRK